MIGRGFAGLPPHAAGQRIGLFGGTFNPPHGGHRAASLMALRRLELDWVWWLVTPGNPFKDLTDLPPIDERIVMAQRLAHHPKIVATGIEKTLGSHYTCDIVQALTARLPAMHFVLVMGADSFADLHRWKHWKRIVATVPVAVIDRPGSTLKATRAPAAVGSSFRRLREADASRLLSQSPPAWVFLHGPRSELSSTQLRWSGPDDPTTSP